MQLIPDSIPSAEIGVEAATMADSTFSEYPGRDSNSYSTRVLEDFESPRPVQHQSKVIGFHVRHIARSTPVGPTAHGAFQRPNPDSFPSLAASFYSWQASSGWCVGLLLLIGAAQ